MKRSRHLRLALVLGALLAASACKSRSMASTAQCAELFDRYIDLKLSESPGAASLSAEQRATRRAKIATEVLSDSDVQQVKTQCQTEVTSAEYDCAVKTTTSKGWNDCIE